MTWIALLPAIADTLHPGKKQICPKGQKALLRRCGIPAA